MTTDNFDKLARWNKPFSTRPQPNHEFIPRLPPIVPPAPPASIVKPSPKKVVHATGPGITRVYQIVDSSGSMGGVWEEMKGLLNEQLIVHKEAVKDEHQVRLTTILFSNDVKPPVIVNFPVEYLEQMPPLEFIGSMTALMDAIGVGIKRADEDFDDGANEAILFQIFTDGLENQSKEYSEEAIKKLIENREKTGKWTFTYFGANQIAEDSAQQLGIARGNACSFSANIVGVQNMSRGLRAKSRGYYATRATGVTNSRCYAGGEGEKSFDNDAKGTI